MATDTAKTLVSSCSSQQKCEYICPSGYVKSGNVCTLQLPSLCTGLIPEHSQLCTDDNKGLTADATRTLVSSCSSQQKCEYICPSGYVKSGNACIIPVPEAPNQCNDNLDNDNDGFADLDDLDCSSLTDSSESGSLQECEPAVSSICGVGGTKACNANGFYGSCIGSEPPKMEVKQDVLIPIIEEIVETLAQAEQTLSKIETNKEETGLELSLSTNEQQAGSITVKVYDEMPTEQSFTIPGLTKQKFIVIEPEIQIENDIKQALLKLNYDESDLGDTPESELRMYYYNEKLKNWVQEPNSGVNTEENYVWAITDHLSLFTLGESTQAELTKYYYDKDRDGYGRNNEFKELEHATGPYSALQGGDCYDAEPLIYPGAMEFFNNRDDNCNGLKDETFPSSPKRLRYTSPKVDGLPVDWFVASTGSKVLPYFDYSGQLSAELYCEYEHNARSLGFQKKEGVSAPNGTYMFYKPIANGEKGFVNVGLWSLQFAWIECSTGPLSTPILLPDITKSPKPKVLHRVVRSCSTNAALSSEQVIPLDVPYTDGKYYTNYKCISRYNEGCVQDRTFDTYYDEWCEY